MRSGVSAKTAPTEPQVQPSCLMPSVSSGSGCGQFGTSSYGPNSSCPPFSRVAAGADAVSVVEDLLSEGAHADSAAQIRIARKIRIAALLPFVRSFVARV